MPLPRTNKVFFLPCLHLLFKIDHSHLEPSYSYRQRNIPSYKRRHSTDYQILFVERNPQHHCCCLAPRVPKIPSILLRPKVNHQTMWKCLQSPCRCLLSRPLCHQQAGWWTCSPLRRLQKPDQRCYWNIPPEPSPRKTAGLYKGNIYLIYYSFNLSIEVFEAWGDGVSPTPTISTVNDP